MLVAATLLGVVGGAAGLLAPLAVAAPQGDNCSDVADRVAAPDGARLALRADSTQDTHGRLNDRPPLARVGAHRRAQSAGRRANHRFFRRCDGLLEQPGAATSARCNTIWFGGRPFVFYRARMTCRKAKAKARRVHRRKRLAGWRCESGSNFVEGGGCRRGRKVFGWHPYD